LISIALFATISMADLTDGLVAYWPLDDDTKDAAGNHDGILGSGASLVNDPERGKVLDVSGSNGAAYMEVAHADDIGFVDSATRTFTISLWAKPANLPRTGWTTVFAKNRPLSPNETVYGLWINPSNVWHFRVAEATNDGPPATAEWQHLVLRHEAGANLHGFVDGQQVVQRGTGTGNVGAIELIIGSADKNGFESYPGLIDDFLIYNRVLDDTEIQQLASGDSITAVAPQDKLTTAWGAIKQ
ncbi:LamG domain-containing protein, partial [Candidatus Poribacteria bacterium]